ncbi:MAG: GMC family oxidoreductase N-terminal domain-containing protein [Parvularculaceae bacterium]|nr:GMC family oxidoreductase N-terminal domain-containing protein [Parvularculaceae bacterium]
MTERSFHFVIVGGGSAGCVLADRLSASGRYTVCLIEAGPPDRDPRIKVPLGLISLMKNPKFDWSFQSEGHDHLGGHRVPIPRGKTLGGSGSINSMVYIRGRASDYDQWAQLGAKGWGWSDVLPYFKRQEQNARLADDDLHGGSGPLHVQDLPSPHPLLETWQQAGEQLQIPRSRDFNGASQEGLGVYQTTMRQGRRWSAADAFLRPALKRENLAVLTGWQAERIEVKDARARGVTLRDSKGKTQTIRVGHELILSAGAIGSPALLLKSGVGPGDQLRALGMEVEIEAPGVGQNLHDHPATAVFHGGGSAGYGLSLKALPSLTMAPVQYLLQRRGLLASNTVEGGGFAKTESHIDEPDVQFHFIPARLGHEDRMVVWGHGYYCDVCLLKPRSRGALKLADPSGKLAIDLNLLADDDDHERLLSGLELLRRLLASEAFDPVRSPELAPGPEVADRESLRAYMHRRLGTAYHPVGTCRMGAADDPRSVVTPALQLIGSQNIRVVDASVMPEIVAGNTNAPTMMIAEKASEAILAATQR